MADLTSDEIKRFWEACGWTGIWHSGASHWYGNQPGHATCSYTATELRSADANAVLEAAQWWCKKAQAALEVTFSYWAGTPWRCEIRRISNVVEYQSTFTEVVIRAVLAAEGVGNG